MGSVKDLSILEKANANSEGRGRFIFSDRYSVFDWGEMPDLIENKGKAITILGAYFFEKLEEQGIPSHYLGLVEDGQTKKLAQVKEPSNTMEVRLLRVLKPGSVEGQYDYSVYKKEKTCLLIPLEVIYRNSLPEGSSVFKRLAAGEISISDLGLSKKPVPNQKLDPPVLDVSTKLEITDRYMTWKEAQTTSALDDQELKDLKRLTLELDDMISREFARIGLQNEDGKFEFGFDAQRNIILVDVLGTLDECRFTYDGLQVSKEIARDYYRKTEWYGATEEAKEIDRQRWKEICRMQPEPLPAELKTYISHIYCACTNEITKRNWFPDTPSISEVLANIQSYLKT